MEITIILGLYRGYIRYIIMGVSQIRGTALSGLRGVPRSLPHFAKAQEGEASARAPTPFLPLA